MGFRCMSDAMVNIRWTLRSAVAAGIVDDSDAQQIIQESKARFYPERSLRVLLSNPRLKLAGPVVASLMAWLPEGQVDMKHQDAITLLTGLRDGTLEPCSQPPRPPSTIHFERLRAQVERSLGLSSLSQSPLPLAHLITAFLHRNPHQQSQSIQAGLFCESHGLDEPSQVDDWLTRHQWSLDDLRDQVRLRALAAELEGQIPAIQRALGHFGAQWPDK